MKVKLDLSNINDIFPEEFTQEELARAKTLFLKKTALLSHKYYRKDSNSSQSTCTRL